MGSKPPQHGSGGSMSSASNSQSENGPSATDPSLQQHPARSGQERPPAAAAQISISQTCSQQAADQPSTAVGRAARGSLPPSGVQQSSDPQVWRSADPQVWPSLGSALSSLKPEGDGNAPAKQCLRGAEYPPARQVRPFGFPLSSLKPDLV